MLANPVSNFVDPFPHIPSELKVLNNWCVWQYQITPYGRTKVPRNPVSHTHKADSTDPSTWVSYEIALANLQGYEGLGFFFSKSAGYTGVDLDDPFTRKDKSVILPEHADYEAAAKTSEQHGRIYNACQSYAELSPSGKGAHIIVKGSIPRGVKSPLKKIEMYDEARFFTMTGQAIRIAPIYEEQEFLTELFASIGKLKDAEGFDPADKPEIDDDETIYNRASNAINGDKFLKLWAGNSDGYPSDSEAHQALMNIIAFYTDNFAQCKRMFLFSKMSSHPKASRPKYLDLTVKRAFDQKPPTIEALTNMSNDFNALLQRQREAAGNPEGLQPAAQVQEGKGNNPPALNDESHGAPLKSTPLHLLKPPPGLLGEVAQYIYQAAPRPVPQIALAGAIGLMAGICGKAFNISNTGLNQYVLLLAETGRGKEAMKSGIRAIISSMLMTNLTADKIVGPGKINSGQALRPYLEQHPTKCFVSIQSEFDNTYSQMVSFNANSAMKELKSQYLDLYMASGSGASTDESIYSDTKKGTDKIKSPAFSLLAECTLTHMNKILTEDQISDGLLTRFLNIVYDGPRVARNEESGKAPSVDMIQKLCLLHALTSKNMAQNIAINIEIDPEAKKIFDDLDKHCDAKMNADGQHIFYALWNRIHLKALKLAGLLAACDYGASTYLPTVTAEYAEWARDVVLHDVENIIARFERHEVGDQTTDVAQLRDLKKNLLLYGKLTETQKATGRITPLMYQDGVFTYKWITSRIAPLASFKNDKQGSAKAIDRALKNLEDMGVIYDIRKDPKAKDKYLTGARAYIFLDYNSLKD